MKRASKAKLIALLIAIATAVALALPATSASAAPRSAAQAAAATPCQNSELGGGFARCTSTSPSGTWASIACASNVNVNANAGSPFNVYAAANSCPVRVWLHQFTDWQAGGWSFCVAPVNLNRSFLATIPAQFQHPMNIYFSANDTDC